MKENGINMIVKCLLLIVLFFTSCAPPSPLELNDTDKQYIEGLTASAEDGWNQGDREPYVERFSTDAIFMAPNMETVVGKEAIRTFANSFPDIKLHYDVIEIMGSADYAYVRGAYTVTDPGGGPLDKGKFLSVWKKSPVGKWFLTHDIFSSDLPLPDPQSTDQED